MIYCKTIITTWQNVDNRTLKTLYGHHFTKNNTQYCTIYQWDYLNREFGKKRLVFPLQFTATCDVLYAVCWNVCLYYRTNDSMCNTFIREVKRACPDTRRALHFARQIMNFARCEGRLHIGLPAPIGGHLLFILHHGCPIDNFLENLVVDCVLSDLTCIWTSQVLRGQCNIIL